MQVQIKADSEASVLQAEKALRYYVTALEDAADTVRIRISVTRDPLGVALYRCRIRATYGSDATLEVDETQGDLALALNRALDRTLRTLRRRAALKRLPRTA